MAKARSEDLSRQAKFVFQGTVRKLRATTLAEIPTSNRTVIVRIDRVIQAPDTLSDYAGQEVTVQLAAGQKVKAGEALIFYTNGWIFGESVAVQAVGVEKATPPGVAALASHPEDPVRSLRTRDALAQTAKADLIVSGRVVAVRLPEEEAHARATAMASGQTTERISEHSPVWQEAVIDIDEVHKGSHTPKQVVVRFPSSTDVRWHKAPKFQAGQEAVFLLHKEQLQREQQLPKTRGLAMAGLGVGPGEYTALNAADVQPIEELPRIKLAAQDEDA